LRLSWFGGRERWLRLDGPLGLLIGLGIIRRASAALKVFKTSLELLAYRRASLSVFVENQTWENLLESSSVSSASRD
jgi:hypothetical protein